MSRRRMLGVGGAGAISALALAACGKSSEDPTVGDAASAGKDPAQDQVTAALDDVVGNYPDSTISLAVYDHGADKLYSYKSDVWSYEASIVKVPISLSVLRNIKTQHGHLSDPQKDLMTQSLGFSDNSATQELFLSLDQTDQEISDQSQDQPGDPDQLSGYEDPESAEVLNATYQKLAVKNTKSDGSWGDNQTHAEDQVQIMRGLAERVDWVNGDDLDFMETVMKPDNDSKNWGVGAVKDRAVGTQGNAEVIVKNGWIQDDAGAWHINSVGVVTAGDAKYSVGLVSKGFSEQDTGQNAASDAVTAYFDHKFGQ